MTKLAAALRRWLARERGREMHDAQDEADPQLAALLDRARSLPRELAPERDLFPEVARRIRTAEVARAQARATSARAWFPRPLAAATAAVVLVVATATATLWLARAPSMPSSPEAIAALAARVRERDGVADVHASLVAILESRSDALPPEVVASLAENLRSFDRAVAEIHVALENHPSEATLAFLLAETHRREAELLERLEWWLGDSGEERS